MRRTAADFLFPLTIALLMAAIAAAIGFVGGIGLCSWMLNGEMGEWALILAPVLALAFGLATFLVALRTLT
jgi:nitrate reductase NapE component